LNWSRSRNSTATDPRRVDAQGAEPGLGRADRDVSGRRHRPAGLEAAPVDGRQDRRGDIAAAGRAADQDGLIDEAAQVLALRARVGIPPHQ
jgi:hypothetical protein